MNPGNHGRPSYIPGAMLILFGLWLLLRQFGRLLPHDDRIYPFLLIAAAVFLLLEALRTSRTGAFFWSVFLFQIGIFFLLRNFDRIPYYSGEEYWPLFLFAFGLGFYVLFIFNYRTWGVLIPAGLFMHFGLYAASHTFDEIPRMLEIMNDHFWPIFFLASGILLLVNRSYAKSPIKIERKESK